MALQPQNRLHDIAAAAQGVGAILNAAEYYTPRVADTIRTIERTVGGVKRKLFGQSTSGPPAKRARASPMASTTLTRRRTYKRRAYTRKRRSYRRKRTYRRKPRYTRKRRTYRRRRRSTYKNRDFTKGKTMWFKVVQNYKHDYQMRGHDSLPKTATNWQTTWLPIPDQYPVKSAIWNNYQEKKLDYVVVKYDNFRVIRELNFADMHDVNSNYQKAKVYWYHKKAQDEDWPQDAATGNEEPYNSLIANYPTKGFTMRYKPDIRTYTGNDWASMHATYNVPHGMAKYLVDHHDKIASPGADDNGFTFDVKVGLDVQYPNELYRRRPEVDPPEPDFDKNYDWIFEMVTFDVTTWSKWTLRRPRPYGKKITTPIECVTDLAPTNQAPRAFDGPSETEITTQLADVDLGDPDMPEGYVSSDEETDMESGSEEEE